MAKYSLTMKGQKQVLFFIRDCAAKRKEILDAGEDTADETNLPTLNDIRSDIEEFIDEEGFYINGWGVTDNYNMSIMLKLGVDFVENSIVDDAISDIQDLSGYVCFTNDKTTSHKSFYILTPKRNILHVFPHKFGKYGVTLEYIPSKECGHACNCTGKSYPDDYTNGPFTKGLLESLEEEGLRLAKEVGAKFYYSYEDFFKGTNLQPFIVL